MKARVVISVAFSGLAIAIMANLRMSGTPHQGEQPSYEASTTSPTPVRPAQVNEPIQPIVAPTGLDARAVDLGRDLFHDPRLSADGSLSCASCHDLARGGTDRLARSVGIHGQLGVINAPSVLNSSLNFRQFWNGRASTLEEQAAGPILAANEMGSSWPDVLRALRSNDRYASRFASIYPDGMTPANVLSAIATYERSLVTPSRFDQYLMGNAAAIDERERRGYALFKSYGCVSCHQGRNVGGNMFQTFGVVANYFADRGDPTEADLGRFAVTKDPADMHVFKVPSLRNVAETPPYFHDGTAATLQDAVRIMGQYQLGRTLTPDEIDLLVAFLQSLSGELPRDELARSRASTRAAAR